MDLVVCRPLGILETDQLLIESPRALEVVSAPSLPDQLAHLDYLSSTLDPRGQGIRLPLKLYGKEPLGDTLGWLNLGLLLLLPI